MAKVDTSNSESGRRITTENARDDSDLPPDSIVVPVSQETFWQDLGTAYDSEDSTRGCTNPKSHSNPFPWSKTSSTSNRVAATNLNPTTSSQIIGLPAKIQRPGFTYCNRPPPIFPRGRNTGSKKSGLADTEPSSPKVSCLGHVLSERERERRRRQRQARREAEHEEEGVFCCAGFSSMLHCGGDKKRRDPRTDEAEVRQPSTVVEVEQSAVEEIQEVKREEPKPLSQKEVPRSPEVEAEAEVVAPAISSMKRFSSGRRAASWGDEVVAENHGRVEETKESN